MCETSRQTADPVQGQRVCVRAAPPPPLTSPAVAPCPVQVPRQHRQRRRLAGTRPPTHARTHARCPRAVLPGTLFGSAVEFNSSAHGTTIPYCLAPVLRPRESRGPVRRRGPGSGRGAVILPPPPPRCRRAPDRRAVPDTPPPRAPAQTNQRVTIGPDPRGAIGVVIGPCPRVIKYAVCVDGENSLRHPPELYARLSEYEKFINHVCDAGWPYKYATKYWSRNFKSPRKTPKTAGPCESGRRGSLGMGLALDRAFGRRRGLLARPSRSGARSRPRLLTPQCARAKLTPAPPRPRPLLTPQLSSRRLTSSWGRRRRRMCPPNGLGWLLAPRCFHKYGMGGA